MLDKWLPLVLAVGRLAGLDALEERAGGADVEADALLHADLRGGEGTVD